MKFNEKLQELRKQKGFTQEELAAKLYVSRAAVSKWESGRGYPNIDSLKAIAKVFSVTVDELLSGDELIVIASEYIKEKQNHLRDDTFSLLDISAVLLLFTPIFRQIVDGNARSVALYGLTGVSPYLKIIFWVLLGSLSAFGILELVLRYCSHKHWQTSKHKISILLSTICTLTFIISMQPYPAAFMMVFLLIKAALLLKLR